MFRRMERYTKLIVVHANIATDNLKLHVTVAKLKAFNVVDEPQKWSSLIENTHKITKTQNKISNLLTLEQLSDIVPVAHMNVEIHTIRCYTWSNTFISNTPNSSDKVLQIPLKNHENQHQIYIHFWK